MNLQLPPQIWFRKEQLTFLWLRLLLIAISLLDAATTPKFLPQKIYNHDFEQSTVELLLKQEYDIFTARLKCKVPQKTPI